MQDIDLPSPDIKRDKKALARDYISILQGRGKNEDENFNDFRQKMKLMNIMSQNSKSKQALLFGMTPEDYQIKLFKENLKQFTLQQIDKQQFDRKDSRGVIREFEFSSEDIDINQDNVTYQKSQEIERKIMEDGKIQEIDVKKILEQQSDYKKQWSDKFIISPKSLSFHIFKIFVVICSFVSSILYAYFAAFRYDLEGDYQHHAMIVTDEQRKVQDAGYFFFESVFAIHLISGFFQEFHPPGHLTPVRNLNAIASQYIQSGHLVSNLIPLIPLTEILQFKHSRLLYFIKCVRLRLSFEILSNKNFLKELRRYNDIKMQKLCEIQQSEIDNGIQKDWSHTENGFLKDKIIIYQIFRAFKVLTVILLGSFFSGIFYYCYCDLNRNEQNNSFIEIYHLDLLNLKEISIVVTYFVFTTLSTIGFGDYVPKNDQERVFISITLLFGVAIFSSVMQLFRDIMIDFGNLDNDFDEADRLSDFFTLLRRYNYDKEINYSTKLNIENYFKFKWNTDKNNAIVSEEQNKLLTQLPIEIQLILLCDFLYKDFVQQFGRLFQFRKWRSINKYHFYSFSDLEYSNFMKDLMLFLAPLQFLKGQKIYSELDEVTEIYFVSKGIYDIGFEINKKEKYVLRQPASTVIGGYECSFEKRSNYSYRAFTKVQTYFMRKKYWKKIQEDYPEFYESLKRDLLTRIYSFIKPVMQKQKAKEIKKYKKRSDYQQIIQMKNYDMSEVERIVLNEYHLRQIQEDEQINYKEQIKKLKKKAIDNKQFAAKYSLPQIAQILRLKSQIEIADEEIAREQIVTQRNINLEEAFEVQLFQFENKFDEKELRLMNYRNSILTRFNRIHANIKIKENKNSILMKQNKLLRQLMGKLPPVQEEDEEFVEFTHSSNHEINEFEYSPRDNLQAVIQHEFELEFDQRIDAQAAEVIQDRHQRVAQIKERLKEMQIRIQERKNIH